MSEFNREKFERLLHDAGGAFADAKAAERAIRDCGGDIKGVEARVIERVRGAVTKKCKCVAAVTKVEEALVLDERKNRQETPHAAHAKQNYTVNGPHEFIEYIPIQGK